MGFRGTIFTFFAVLFLVVAIIVIRSIYFYRRSDSKAKDGSSPVVPEVESFTAGIDKIAMEEVIKPIFNTIDTIIDPFVDEEINDNTTSTIGIPAEKIPKKAAKVFVPTEVDKPKYVVCNDPVWCYIPIPEKSLFRFATPPSNQYRWNLAQKQAADGEQVLLQKARGAFPNHLDFIDGEILFRAWHHLSDVFLDHNTGLEELTAENKRGPKRMTYKWEKWGAHDIVPRGYNYRSMQRAPVVQLGYYAFNRDNKSNYFQGPHLGEAVMELADFIDKWRRVKDRINTPFIVLHQANENWGLFSLEFPNRTINWGDCCFQRPKNVIHQILDHPKTLLFAVNQHHNLTHPKVISLPRGIPIFNTHRKQHIWDTMRVYAKTIKKDSLMFASNSNWKHRPYVSKCVASKFDAKEAKLNGWGADGSTRRIPESEYYKKIASSRTNICLPGLGYDSFRLWETLTFGTVAVLEKGTGLDKALWRLPALLVDDFDDVTPALLRQAYVEALYRVNEFEFERLTQSFWYSFIMNVSAEASIDAVYHKFPPESYDATFTRPRVPYQCALGKDFTCGPGTKRIPKTTCGGFPEKK